MKRIPDPLALALLLGALLLSGCSDQRKTEAAPATVTATRTVTATAAAAAPEAPESAATVTVTETATATAAPEPAEEPTEDASKEPAEEPADGDGTLKFGSSGIVYDDGLQVSVSKPEPYKPSSSASVREGDKTFVVFTITIKNGTDEVFDPSLFTSTASTGDREADQVFDTEKGVAGAPGTKLLKGRTAKFKVAYGVDKGKELVLEVSPSFEHDSHVFTE